MTGLTGGFKANGLNTVIAAQLVGNAVLLGIAYYWLGVGESDAMHLLGSALLIAIVLFGAAWLHGATLAHFRSESHALRSIAAKPLTRWLPLVAMAMLTALAYIAAEGWNPVTDDRINRLSSYLTLTLQRPVRPAAVQSVLSWLWWAVEWMAIPVLLAPLASAVAVRGWAGFAEIGRGLKQWSLWITIPVTLAACVWLPLRLVSWTPGVSSFGMEVFSLIVRFALAYLLFIAGSLTIAFITSPGKPVLSQPTTTVSP